jgi:predicted Zn-dependent protease with MMP-like domain
VNPKLRKLFDSALDEVVADLPPQVRKLLDEVSLVTEDYPSRDVMRRTGVRHRAQLCGLYTGIPLINRSVEQSGILSDVIHIYREGVFSLAVGSDRQFNPAKLRQEIRKTILHELGHHHGLTERDLSDLGYG